jgi:hypothetical protein
MPHSQDHQLAALMASVSSSWSFVVERVMQLIRMPPFCGCVRIQRANHVVIVRFLTLAAMQCYSLTTHSCHYTD